MKGLIQYILVIALALVVLAANLSGGGIASANSSGGQFQPTTLGGQSYNCFYSNDANGVPQFQGCLIPIQQPNGNFTSYYYYTYATGLNAQRLNCSNPQWVPTLYIVDQGSWRYIYDYGIQQNPNPMAVNWYVTNGTSTFKHIAAGSSEPYWIPLDAAPNGQTYSDWLQGIYGVHSCK